MPSRRRFVGSLALGAVALAGCVNRAPTDTEPADGDPATTAPDPATTAGSSPTATTEQPTDALAAASENDRDPLRPDGDPVAVERTITDPELDYLPEEDAVRYPAYYRRTGRGPDGQPTRTTIFETTPFEDWGETECASVAADEVRAVVEPAVDGDPNLSVGITNREGEMAVTVQQTTTLNRQGTVVSEPTTPFERVVAVTPRSVDATVHLEGQTHATTVPVWASETTLQYD